MRIASVEDDPDQAELIRQILGEAGFECESFANGADFLRALRERAFDLLMVDWQLPGTSGYELVSWVRQKSGNMPPILFVTSRTGEADIVAGLSVGADDYMLKPIRAGELIARVRSLLRRAYPEAAQEVEQIRRGNYTVDPHTRAINLGGQPVQLSPREYELALFLFRNAGRLLAREVVEQAVWGRAMGAGSRTLDTHISRLRLKLALRPENGVRLTSVYSHGYRFEEISAAEVEANEAGADA
ncbi:DNA-binding response regulator [Cupriavidus sp. TA19]|uniref:response regulator transcription factor n=1 Tax=unclassified Cupriavidus TaxID=2640874 RepID=UPI000E2E65F2|nr:MULTISPECIES: response regulator transcription factor [unclassified Cupriavidus]BDB28190.1 response regulator transcription factor [Cupriavidus sp. P-10]GLC94253.1 DNA-binding response regulator [Cupriavidus sp. TA19]